MKKNVLGLLLMLLVFVACEGPMGPQGPPGDGGIEGWKIVDVTIPSKEWVLTYDADGLNPRFHCYVDIPEISNYVYDDGLVFAYLVQNYGTNDEVQTSLNCSVPFENEYGDMWTEHYSWDYTTGSVAFYLTYSDFFVDFQPATQHFKLVMLW